MPKLKFQRETTAEMEKAKIEKYYRSKYFSLFLNAYEFDNLTPEQSRYLLKKLWAKGSACAFILEGSKKDPTLAEILSNSSDKTLNVGEENPNGLLMITQFAPVQYNAFDEPSAVNYINARGTTFIPKGTYIVGKDCVIIWGHRSHESIADLCEFYISRIVDVEMTINMNLFAQKLPRLVVCSPEDRSRVDEIVKALERGEKKIFIDINDYNAIKNVLESGSSSQVLPVLYTYKTQLENELMTFLGINNVNIQKRERLITDEANANNEVIIDSSDCFLDCLKEGCNQIVNVLGYPTGVKAKESPIMKEENSLDPEDDEDNQGGEE